LAPLLRLGTFDPPQSGVVFGVLGPFGILLAAWTAVQRWSRLLRDRRAGPLALGVVLPISILLLAAYHGAAVSVMAVFAAPLIAQQIAAVRHLESRAFRRVAAGSFVFSFLVHAFWLHLPWVAQAGASDWIVRDGPVTGAALLVGGLAQASNFGKPLTESDLWRAVLFGGLAAYFLAALTGL
jgi:hypothetical protein